MPVPKRRTSRTKRDKRRAHDGLPLTTWISCPSCTEPMLRHRACPHCGEYRGRKIMNVESV